jgi:hypothetical protein
LAERALSGMPRVLPQDLERIEHLARVQDTGDPRAEAEFRADDEALRTQANTGMDVEEMEASSASAAAKRRKDDKKREDKGGKGRIKLKPLPEGRVDVVKERRKAKLLSRRQERLLFPCIHLLLNLAEDDELERKMCRRGVIGLLLPMLDRPHRELLMLASTFLRKLSLIEENKDTMAAMGIVRKIGRWLNSGDTMLTVSMLRLLFNLTFDGGLCSEITRSGLLPRIAVLLREAPFRAVTLRILYHISIDDA